MFNKKNGLQFPCESKVFQYFGDKRLNLAAPDPLVKIMKVMNYTALWDVQLVCHSLGANWHSQQKILIPISTKG